MTIFSNNLQRMFRKKSSWIYLLVLPIIVNVFIVALSTQQATWVIGVQDDDGSAVAKAFTDTFGEDSMIIDIEDSETAVDALKESQVDLVITFDQGYGDKVAAGDAPTADVMDRGDNNQTDSLKARIDAFLSGINAIGEAVQGDTQKFDAGLSYYLDQKFTADYLSFDRSSADEAARSVNTLGYLAFGLLLMMGSVAALLLDDRVRGVFDRVRLTPLSSASYFLQYFLSMVVIAMAQFAAVLAIIPVMTGVTYGSTIQQVAGVSVSTLCFVLFAVALSVLIHRFAKSSTFAATLYSLITLPMLMLSGALWPRDIMPDVMQRIGDYMPSRWYLDAAEYALQEDYTRMVLPLGLLLGLTAIMLIGTFVIRTDKHR